MELEINLLTLDISNSHTTFGIFEGEQADGPLADNPRAPDLRRVVPRPPGLITRTTLAEVEAVAVAAPCRRSSG